MCYPAVGLAISLAGTALSAVNQYRQGKAQAQAAQQAANYNAQVAANEQATQQQLAQAELQKGAEERNRVVRAGLAKQGEMAGGMGAKGFALDSGSNLSLLAQSAEEIQQDVSMTNQNANMAAWNHLAQATRAGNEGAFARYQGRLASQDNGRTLGLVGTVLGGIGQGVSGYYDIKGSGTQAGPVNLNQALGQPKKNYSLNKNLWGY
jgi:hypothetical protein